MSEDAACRATGEPRDTVCTYCGWAGSSKPNVKGWHICPECNYVLILLPLPEVNDARP